MKLLLGDYLEKLKERKFVFPVEISVFIITQVCQALYYAHTYTDKLTGEERGCRVSRCIFRSCLPKLDF